MLRGLLDERWEETVSGFLDISRSGAQHGARLLLSALCIRPKRPKRLCGRSLRQLEEALRCLPIPILGRVAEDALWLDLRQLDDEAGFLEQLPHLKQELTT